MWCLESSVLQSDASRPCRIQIPSSSHTSLPALLKGRVPHCRLSGKLLDNTRILPGFQALHSLDNVITEAVAFRANKLHITAPRTRPPPYAADLLEGGYAEEAAYSAYRTNTLRHAGPPYRAHALQHQRQGIEARGRGCRVRHQVQEKCWHQKGSGATPWLTLHLGWLVRSLFVAHRAGIACGTSHTLVTSNGYSLCIKSNSVRFGATQISP
jgi:hypothetical protein